MNETIKYHKIGVFGGTFDPIHNGHVNLAMAAIDELELDKLIVMPAKVQPFKQGKKVTDEFHRLNMAKLAFMNKENTEVSDHEIHNSVISYTYETLNFIRDKYPDSEIIFITGADSFMEIHRWYKGTYLLENFSFAVSTRPGYDAKKLDSRVNEYKELYKTNATRLVAQMPSISSTEIREKLKAGESASDLIPASVERYIKENGLYK